MSRFDAFFKRQTRELARHTSRRGFLSTLGMALLGIGAAPLLPIARAATQKPGEPDAATPQGDDTACEYWRYCALDGFIAACCGGDAHTCPPGTEMSPVSWIGTCRNPADGKNYVVSYNDCCGKTFCQRCFCNRNEGDKPVYYPSKSNDVNWCMGKAGIVYNSTVSIVIGVEPG
jgi:methylamine dehydrogenase light chain